MKAIYYFGVLILSATLLTACGGDEAAADSGIETTVPEITVDTAQFLTDLAAIEKELENNLSMPKEKDLKRAVTEFLTFVDYFPNDPQSPDYLLRASDISLTLDNPKKSVRLLERIETEYPNYKRMEDVKYNRASHLDFELRDTTAAKVAYQEFIDTYPNSPLVNDCKSRIENIQYSMEELTEKFMKELEANGTN